MDVSQLSRLNAAKSWMQELATYVVVLQKSWPLIKKSGKTRFVLGVCTIHQRLLSHVCFPNLRLFCSFEVSYTIYTNLAFFDFCTKKQKHIGSITRRQFKKPKVNQFKKFIGLEQSFPNFDSV